MSVRVQRLPLGIGYNGVRQTLAVMSQLVRRDQSVPYVVETARALATAAGGNSLATAGVIRGFLLQAWRYVPDPIEDEHLEDADYLLSRYAALSYIPGDCDELAILGATLGMAIGLQATWTVLAFGDEDNAPVMYSHVYATLLTPSGQATTLDLTRPRGPVAPVLAAETFPV